MTDLATESSRSLRIPFIHDGELDSPEFKERLEAGELSVVAHRQQKELEILECESRDPGYLGSVVISRAHASPDLGSVSIAGPGRVDLAMSLVPAFSYVPAVVLHLGARSAPERDARLTSLQVLSLLHLAEEKESYWDASIEATTRLLRQDPEGELRRQALFVELMGHPAAALRHIRELLAAETDAEERRQLEILRDVAGQRAQASREQDLSVFPEEPELRLALPFIQNAPLDEIVSRFSELCTRVQQMRAPVEGGARLVELAANDYDARLYFVAVEGARIGCLYFSGTDTFSMALGAAMGLAYFPPELARHVARSSKYPDFRAQAIQALALAASTRILPGKGVDSELRALLQAALSDREPQVQGTAVNMSLLLREELGQPT